MVIHVTIDTAEPLTGSASCDEREPVPFVGWLQMLRAVAELVGAPGCTADQHPPDAAAGEISAKPCGDAQARVRTVGSQVADLTTLAPQIMGPQVAGSQATGAQQIQTHLPSQRAQAPVGEGPPA